MRDKSYIRWQGGMGRRRLRIENVIIFRIYYTKRSTMIKDIENRNEGVKTNDKEITVLKEYFPSCFQKDGSFDIAKLQEQLKDKVDVIHEGYELNFLGKSYAKLLASIDTTTVIKPDTEHNDKPENKNSENIYISGDNLDGLKHLLKSYSRQVKCIYIDEPYNTGTDGFVYKDKFNFTSEELQRKLSIDENQAQRILDLTKRKSASHSAWLMFMYSRLQLARDLLTNDGVIFISIDDNEQANLKLICDDIFSEENFVANITIVNNPRGRDYGGVAKMHEYILVYTRGPLAEINDLNEPDKVFPFEDNISGFELRELRNRNIAFNKENRPNLYYPFYINPNKKDNNGLYEISLSHQEGFIELYPKESQGYDTVWRWGRIKSEENLNINIAGKAMEDGGYQIAEKYRKTTKMARSVWWDKEDNSEKGTLLLKSLFNKKVFDFPKSVDMLTKLFEMGTNNVNDIILDFFSGSASSAHAVMKINALDGGNRKCISIQIPQLLDPKNPQQKVAYEFLKSINRPTTLNYIGIERIIRAAKKIKEETKADIDYGFKHFELREVNENTLDKCETFDKTAMIADRSILDDFGTASVLTTWLVNDGYGFNAKVETIDLKGYTAYYCKKHLYLINPNLTQDSVANLYEKYDSIAGFNPENIVLFGYSFNEWSITDMLEKNLRVLNDSEKNLKINIDVRY